MENVAGKTRSSAVFPRLSAGGSPAFPYPAECFNLPPRARREIFGKILRFADWPMGISFFCGRLFKGYGAFAMYMNFHLVSVSKTARLFCRAPAQRGNFVRGLRGAGIVSDRRPAVLCFSRGNNGIFCYCQRPERGGEQMFRMTEND
ncbi:MAG: hypothetical protein J6J65_07470 [Opitutales bacterium]|nr:hypothetical protein [Opitutales bacterium]